LREIAAPDDRDRVSRLAFEARYHLALRDLPGKIAAVEPAHRKKIRPAVVANLRELPRVAARNWPFLQPAIDTVLKLSETAPDAGETFERLVEVSLLIGSDPGGYVVETPKVSAALYAALSATALRLGDQVAAVQLAIGALRAREQDSENRQGFLQALQTMEKLLPSGAPIEPYKQQLLAVGWGYIDVAWNLLDALEARDESKKLPAGEIETARRIVDLGQALHRRSEAVFAGDGSHLVRLAEGFVALGAIVYMDRNSLPLSHTSKNPCGFALVWLRRGRMRHKPGAISPVRSTFSTRAFGHKADRPQCLPMMPRYFRHKRSQPSAKVSRIGARPERLAPNKR
jgi:hypothetical protein